MKIVANNLDPIYIVGPTASGKSALAVEVARIFDSIIISADSMQIYKGLDVGTAKVEKSLQEEIEHKLIDVVNADGEFSVAEFTNLARQEIQNAQQRGKLPIVVGGTGLYFEALFYPMSFAGTVKNPDLREQLNDDLNKFGAHSLHQRLAELDQESADRLHENDTKRVIRALEIILTTGKTLKQNRDDIEKPSVFVVGLNTDRAVLYDKINKRVDQMFEQGLVDEVLRIGNFDYQSMQAIGYKEFAGINYKVVDGKFVLDEKDLLEVKDKIKQHSRNYAKRQLTWFRKYDFVNWFDCSDIQSAIKFIENHVQNHNEDCKTTNT